MLRYCKMRVVQAMETFRGGSLRGFLKETFYLHREAVPVEIDLSLLRPAGDFPCPAGTEIVEITPDFLESRPLCYPVESRHLKALDYLGRGYRGYALLAGDTVSGDIWCAYSPLGQGGRKHPDEEWLGVTCGEREVYTFDMFVVPQKRGGNAASALQNGALHALREEGFTKAYGFFWSDNVPALWVHRTLRWQELTRVRASRLLLSRKLWVKQHTPP